MRADRTTGHVLDENCDLVTTDTQIVYSIFDAKQQALNSALELIKNAKGMDIECVIQDANQKLIAFVNRENIDSF